jgi:hypothetical protein
MNISPISFEAFRGARFESGFDGEAKTALESVVCHLA